MPVYAVIDTNVLVSALISKNGESATVQVLRAVFDGRIAPLLHEEILKEYDEVLRRDRFRLNEATVHTVLAAFRQFGLFVSPTPTGEMLPDMDDLVFYEVAMEKEKDHAYLVTGNRKHYPTKRFIVTPAEMMAILSGQE